MSKFLIVDAQIDDVKKSLSNTNKRLKAIRKQTLGIIGKTTVKAIKTAIKSTDLQKRTGELLKAYRYKVKKNGLAANIFPKSKTKKGNAIFPKVMALSYGVEKSNRYIAPRGFVQKGREFAESGNYKPEIDKMIQKELDKYWT